MLTLDTIREELDEIDAQMVALFEKRMALCHQVGDYKVKNKRPVFDPVREQEKIRSVKEQAHGSWNQKAVEELFEQLMSMSRKLQYQVMAEQGEGERLPFIKVDHLLEEKTKIVFPGAEGSYTQVAMEQYFGESLHCFFEGTFKETLQALEDGRADYAVLPIENSSAGAVHEVYDLLVQYENYIVGETFLPIEHTLAGLPGTKLPFVERVYSHPQGLMQCQEFLEKHSKWEAISMPNTALAAQKIREEQDTTQVAICSSYAAKAHGLTVLKDKIQDQKNNTTRFIVIANQKIFLPQAKKISICFEIAHKSGSLYHLLSHFIYNNLNMTKIESRPILDRPFEYRFFIDFEGNLSDPAVKNALRGLREEARTLSILGNY